LFSTELRSRPRVIQGSATALRERDWRCATASILIAEDELLVALHIEDLVRDLGHDVVGPAARIEEVLRLVRTERFDAALLDVSLHLGKKVYPAAELLIAHRIPFTFMTAYGRDGLDPGYAMHPVVKKPFTQAALESALVELLATAPS
jgi:CheY-like chemotaxis protein